MKIGQVPPLPPRDDAGSSTPRTSHDEPVADEATKVTISKNAAFIADMRRRAEQASPAVRDELVEQVRAELAQGTFESNTDVQRVIDGLLADL